MHENSTVTKRQKMQHRVAGPRVRRWWARRLRADLLVVLVVMSLVSCTSGTDEGVERAAAEVDQRSLVLITLDTTRRDHIGTYGSSETSLTPHIDSLAAGGTVFDFAISTAAVTPVAHASMLTGLLNHNHGLRVLAAESGYQIRPDQTTLTTILKAAGYHTVAVHSAFPVSASFGFAGGFDIFDSFETGVVSTNQDDEFRDWNVRQFQRRSDETTTRTIELLGEPADPVFLWVHYWDPHDRLILPPGDELAGRDMAALSDDEKREIYAAEVEYMDQEIGRLLAHLDRVLPEAIVIVVADHGQGLGDHGVWAHRILYQEQILVPLIMRVPGLDQVQRLGDLVRTTDILPTVLDLLEIEAPEGLDGISLVAQLEGAGAPGLDRTAFSDQISLFDLNARAASKSRADLLFSATTTSGKLIYRPTQPLESEYYDLSADPAELENLFSLDRPEVLDLLAQLGDEAPWVLQPFEIQGEGLGEGVSEALAALGYVPDDEEQAETEIRWLWFCPGAAGLTAVDPALPNDCESGLVPRLDI